MQPLERAAHLERRIARDCTLRVDSHLGSSIDRGEPPGKRPQGRRHRYAMQAPDEEGSEEGPAPKRCGPCETNRSEHAGRPVPQCTITPLSRNLPCARPNWVRKHYAVREDPCRYFSLDCVAGNC